MQVSGAGRRRAKCASAVQRETEVLLMTQAFSMFRRDSPSRMQWKLGMAVVSGPRLPLERLLRLLPQKSDLLSDFAFQIAVEVLQSGAESVSTCFSPFWPFTILEAVQVSLCLDPHFATHNRDRCHSWLD
jgi:hypothetical protein